MVGILTPILKATMSDHTVVDTHPDSSHTLRVDHPFPALEEYASKLDLDAMDSMEHSHVPFVVLLVRAAAQWKDFVSDHGSEEANTQHEGKLPVYEQKDEFKKFLAAGKRKGDEENFQEAEEKAFLVTSTSEVSQEQRRARSPNRFDTQIPYNIKSLLEEQTVKNVSSGVSFSPGSIVIGPDGESKNLHILLHALGKYLESDALPPLSPSLPDMHSSTTAYIALQNLYKEQHKADLAKYRSILSTVLESIGLPADAIPDGEVEGFVKNSSGVAIIKGTALQGRQEVGSKIKEIIGTLNFLTGTNCQMSNCWQSGQKPDMPLDSFSLSRHLNDIM